MHSFVRRSVAVAALGLGLLVPPTVSTAGTAGAHAEPAARAATGPGSIVFIRAHNVWIAKGDGTGAFQVTFDGDATTPYLSPSQSDNGLIAAGHGPHVVVMTQNGTVLSMMDPPPLQNSVSHPLDGPPVQVSISPNGELVAYTFNSWECAVGVECSGYRATGITRTDRLTPASTYGQSFFWAPSWVSNSRLLQSGGYLSQVMLKDLGAEPVHWFDDQDLPEVGPGQSTDLDDADLSPDGRWLATVRGYGAETRIAWYTVSGDARNGAPPAVPDWLCATSALEGLASPTWSPDSSVLAWQEPDGIWTIQPHPSECGTTPALLIPDASSPDWSPAALAPAPRQYVAEAKPRLRGPAKVGKVLTVRAGAWSPTPAKITYRWLRNGKPIAKATKPRYKLSKADRGRRVSVRVTASGGEWKPTSVTSKPTKKVR